MYAASGLGAFIHAPNEWDELKKCVLKKTGPSSYRLFPRTRPTGWQLSAGAQLAYLQKSHDGNALIFIFGVRSIDPLEIRIVRCSAQAGWLLQGWHSVPNMTGAPLLCSAPSAGAVSQSTSGLGAMQTGPQFSETGKPCSFLGKLDYWDPSWKCSDKTRYSKNSAVNNYTAWLHSVVRTADPSSPDCGTIIGAPCGNLAATVTAARGANFGKAWLEDIAAGTWQKPIEGGGGDVPPAGFFASNPDEYVHGGPADPAVVAAAEDKKRKLIMYGGIGVAALAVVGGLWYYSKS